VRSPSDLATTITREARARSKKRSQRVLETALGRPLSPEKQKSRQKKSVEPGVEQLTRRLHSAVSGRMLRETRELLILGGDPKAFDANGRTALMIAVEANHVELAKELAPVSDLTAAKWNGPALICAARHGCAEIIDLLSPGSDPDARNADGETALIVAAKHRRPHAVETLLNVCDPAAQDSEGRTALFALMGQLSVSPEALDCLRLLAPKSNLSEAPQRPSALAFALEWNLDPMAAIVAEHLPLDVLRDQLGAIPAELAEGLEDRWRPFPAAFAKLEALALQALLEATDSAGARGRCAFSRRPPKSL